MRSATDVHVFSSYLVFVLAAGLRIGYLAKMKALTGAVISYVSEYNFVRSSNKMEI